MQNQLAQIKQKPNLDLRTFTLKYNHIKENSEIYDLRFFNRYQLMHFLISKGFGKESIKFFRANIDGNGFIFLMANPQGIKYIDHLFKFSLRQSNNLRKFYSKIYRFRQIHCNDFKIDEIPLFFKHF